MLEGDRLVNTPYDIKFRVDKENEDLCSRELTAKDLKRLRTAVKKDYYFQVPTFLLCPSTSPLRALYVSSHALLKFGLDVVLKILTDHAMAMIEGSQSKTFNTAALCDGLERMQR